MPCVCPVKVVFLNLRVQGSMGKKPYWCRLDPIGQAPCPTCQQHCTCVDPPALLIGCSP